VLDGEACKQPWWHNNSPNSHWRAFSHAITGCFDDGEGAGCTEAWIVLEWKAFWNFFFPSLWTISKPLPQILASNVISVTFQTTSAERKQIDSAGQTVLLGTVWFLLAPRSNVIVLLFRGKA
jgi:hypothetical protein